jgi:hypothetical protein
MPKATDSRTQTLHRVSIAGMYTADEMKDRGRFDDDNKTFDQILAGYVPDGESRETLYFLNLTHLAINSDGNCHESVAAEGWCKAVGLQRLGMLEDHDMTPPECIRDAYRSSDFMKQFLSPIPTGLEFLLAHLDVQRVYGEEAKTASAWFLHNEVETWVIHVREIKAPKMKNRLPNSAS